MQIEYVAVKHSKRSHEGFCHILIGFIMGLFVMGGLALVAKADEQPIAVIYTDEYLAKHPVEIGIAPGENAVVDDTEAFPYSEEVPLSPAIQEYIWLKCKAATKDYMNYYYFMLGAIELESQFKSGAVHYNTNGSVDRGLCQINSCNVKKMKRLGLINSTDDLFDIYANINCGFALMDEYIGMFGVSEAAYYAYNTGKKKSGSNRNSRTVMSNMSKWRSVLS